MNIIKSIYLYIYGRGEGLTHDPPASASQVLGLQVYTTMPSFFFYSPWAKHLSQDLLQHIVFKYKKNRKVQPGGAGGQHPGPQGPGAYMPDFQY
jgi:hypothetical protein